MTESNDRLAEEACHICGDIVSVDGVEAIERWGEVLCRGCVDKPVEFKATCSSQLCPWSYSVEETEFNRGHAKTRAQQEANQHEKANEVFNDDPMHRTTVKELRTS